MSYYRKKNDQKVMQNLWPENQFQILLCLERIKQNFYWKMKFSK